MKRRSFMALPFVAAIAGVAKTCFGREPTKPDHIVAWDWQEHTCVLGDGTTRLIREGDEGWHGGNSVDLDTGEGIVFLIQYDRRTNILVRIVVDNAGKMVTSGGFTKYAAEVRRLHILP